MLGEICFWLEQNHVGDITKLTSGGGLLIGQKAVNAGGNPGTGPAVFATTHWSVVLEAGQNDSPKASEALALLCRTYWYPLYAYVRRKGYSPEDSEDMAQEFFARLLEKGYLSVADRNRGRFRSFLLGTFEHFLAKEWRRSHAQKRGSGQSLISLDAVEAENRHLLEPADELTPEKIYDRCWATTVLEQAMARLRADHQTGGKAPFEMLEPFLSGDDSPSSYAQIAVSLEMTEGAFKMAVHRMRQRYGDLVRAEIAQTVATQEEADAELRYLFAVLRE